MTYKTKQYSNLSTEAEKVLLPAIQRFQAVLVEFTRDAGEEVSFELNFKASSNDDAVQVVFTCPHEFGDACNLLVESVIAFGGACHQTPHNTVCNLPD